jgi:radical SAM superfamily enzyme YgiQ (UPF0313 family)
MMKIALIMIDPAIGKRGHRAGGAAYSLVAYLKEKNPFRSNIDIKIFSFNSLYYGPFNINVLAVAEYKPDVIGISAYCWNYRHVKNYVKTFKSLLPNTILILGGPEVSYETKMAMEELEEVDIIVRGEGELTFNDLITSIYKSENDYGNILGIAYRDINKTIVINPDRPIHSTLDDFPSPFLTGVIDLDKSDAEVAFETVRGCRFKCSYCLYTKGLNTVRHFSLDRVEKELRLILKSPHVKIIWFVDPTFNENEERALKILKIIEKYNPQMPLAFELRADCLTEALIEQFGKLNVSEVAIGLQSYSEEVNKHVKRQNNFDMIEEKLAKLMQSISHTCEQFDIDIIYGLPGDVYANYKKSAEYIISLGGRIFYQPLRIFKGTQLFYDTKEFGIISNAEPPYNIIASSTYTEEEMISTFCLNVGIDFFNRGGVIKSIIQEVVKVLGISYCDFMEKIGRFFWEAQEYDIFRVSNWTPDDRDDKVVMNCFIRAVIHCLKSQNNKHIIDYINNKLKDYIDKNESCINRVLDEKAAYFYLSI